MRERPSARRARPILAALFVLAAAAWPAPSRGQVRTPDARALDSLTTAVAKQLRCPVCRQLSVNESPSELARQMKTLIRQRLAQGETQAQVRAYFVSKYGDWILLKPPKKGLDLLVWLGPVLGLAFGGVILGLGFRRWLGSGREGDDSGPDGDRGFGPGGANGSPPEQDDARRTPTMTRTPGGVG